MLLKMCQIGAEKCVEGLCAGQILQARLRMSSY